MYKFSNPFAEWSRDFKLLAVATCSVGVFFGVQLTLFNNYIVDQFGIEPHELGALEGLREVPGLLNVLMILLLIRRPLPVMGGAMLMIMGFGLMAYGAVTSVFTLAVFSLVWSIGFHGWVPLGQSMALRLSPPGNKGKWLGQLRSAESLSWLLAIGACMVGLSALKYQGLFVVGGGVTVLGGVALFFVTRESALKKEKGFVFKRRYGVYYALNFLQGCRKQMFITFAIFALVKVHGMSVETTMVLVLINQILVFLTAPLMGRLVDYYGERSMLTVSYIGLALVFFGYAVIQDRTILYVLYCIDNLIFFGGIALTTYVHKIASEEDLQPTLSMGVTMNHVAAVIAPLVGGVVWYYLGYQVIFFSGSALAVVSLIVSRKVNPDAQLAQDEPES